MGWYDLNEEKIFIAEDIHGTIFVLNSNFEIQFEFDYEILFTPTLMAIDNEFDKSRLYVLDCDKLIILGTSNGSLQ